MRTRVRSCIGVRSRAGADDALIRGTCASATRSLRKAIHRWNTHRHTYIHMMHACIYIHACLATPTNGSPMRGPPPTRARVLRLCARARVRVRSGAHTSAPKKCQRLPSAWTAGGSARRRSPGRRRSTRTSARGTPPRSPRYTRYAPPFRPGGAPPPRDALGGSSMRPKPLCAARPPMRARVCGCADVWTRACAGVHVCRYSCAQE